MPKPGHPWYMMVLFLTRLFMSLGATALLALVGWHYLPAAYHTHIWALVIYIWIVVTSLAWASGAYTSAPADPAFVAPAGVLRPQGGRSTWHARRLHRREANNRTYGDPNNGMDAWPLP